MDSADEQAASDIITRHGASSPLADPGFSRPELPPGALRASAFIRASVEDRAAALEAQERAHGVWEAFPTAAGRYLVRRASAAAPDG